LTPNRSALTYKSRRAQTVIQGEPLILIENGQPIAKNLRSDRLDLDDVAQEARGQGIESIERSNGAFSKRAAP
jgi:uncharacterized membrane protein YcaP (DUF421 family)